MSAERTEKATPHKREEARKKGQIARGAELPATLTFLAIIFALNSLGPELFTKISFYIQNTALKVANPIEFTTADIQDIFIEAVNLLAVLFIPIVAVALTAGLAGNFAQGGFSFTPSALLPKADKFNPVSNLKRIFGLDSVVNLAKSSLKLLLLGSVAYGVLTPVFKNAPLLIHAPLATVGTTLGETLYSLALRCGLLMLAFAGADYGYSWYKNEKSLKMSKQEIRDEFKDQEGDPLVKGQRRRAARALTQKRSLAEVPKASVIITNPTHISIALRYDREKDAAPIVVAKGADIMAAKIREIAKENNIPLFENKLLARALYKSVEPNQIIPIEFFGAVAEILAYVFRQREN